MRILIVEDDTLLGEGLVTALKRQGDTVDWLQDGAAAIIALADTAAGYATRAHLPDGASSFTTIELKTNFFGTQAEGVLLCEATAVHGGRHTQVWDAEVSSGGSGSRLALFRCTQMILWPKGPQS